MVEAITVFSEVTLSKGHGRGTLHPIIMLSKKVIRRTCQIELRTFP